MALFRATAPAIDPLTLAETKTHLRITASITEDDDYVEDTLIPTAVQRGEGATNRAFITQTWDLKLDRFPCGDWIWMPKPPLLTITSITYIDTAGTSTTWASSNYAVDAPTGPKAQRGRVALAYGVSWPATRPQANAVTIRFTCGYGATAAAVPVRLRRAMLVDIGSMYGPGREDLVVGAVSGSLARSSTAGGVYWDHRSPAGNLCPRCVRDACVGS